MMQFHQLSKNHRLLGYAGLIPFVTLALAAITLDAYFAAWLISYAALILTFLGGIIWTYSMAESAPRHSSWVAIGVMLWAWFWLVCEPPYTLLLAAGSFVALHIYERIYLSDLYAESFMQMRLYLSSIAAISLLSAAAFTSF